MGWQPDPSSACRRDDINSDRHTSCVRSWQKCSVKDIHHLLQLIHGACPSFTVAAAAVVAPDQCLVQIRKDESGIDVWWGQGPGSGCWENDIFIRGFVRLGFSVRGRDTRGLQRHVPSIRTPLMKIISSSRVRGQGWGHLIPQRDMESLKAPMLSHTGGEREHAHTCTLTHEQIPFCTRCRQITQHEEMIQSLSLFPQIALYSNLDESWTWVSLEVDGVV